MKLKDRLESTFHDTFVDYKKLIPLFSNWLDQPVFPKRLLVIQGLGGTGKTSYLNVFSKISQDLEQLARRFMQFLGY
jgi:hypothetical protein